jgi:hypothetical protein
MKSLQARSAKSNDDDGSDDEEDDSDENKNFPTTSNQRLPPPQSSPDRPSFSTTKGRTKTDRTNYSYHTSIHIFSLCYYWYNNIFLLLL